MVESAATLSHVVTRHVLYVTDEGLPCLVPLGDAAVAFGQGSLALRCRGSEMAATVTVERHAREPDHPAAPWEVVVTGSWELTSGHLAVVDLEGLLEWFPDLGLDAGWWSVRVSTAGGDAAELLEDELYEEFEAEFTAAQQAAEEGTSSGLTAAEGAVAQGPERWLVQLWR